MLSISSPNSLALNLNEDRDRQDNSSQAKKFLRFYLGSGDRFEGDRTITHNRDLALLEAEIVTEVMTISPQELLPVPQMPYCVLGIYSWRSEMLWVVDLENLLGYPPSLANEATDNDTLLVMVVQVQGQSLGLVVSQIDNIIEQNIASFKSSSSEIFSEDIMPFLHGYFTDNGNNIVMLIDAEEILRFFSISPIVESFPEP